MNIEVKTITIAVLISLIPFVFADENFILSCYQCDVAVDETCESVSNSTRINNECHTGCELQLSRHKIMNMIRSCYSVYCPFNYICCHCYHSLCNDFINCGDIRFEKYKPNSVISTFGAKKVVLVVTSHLLKIYFDNNQYH